jgi:hypothetical protein
MVNKKINNNNQNKKQTLEDVLGPDTGLWLGNIDK